ncbi:unnamed protein product [Eruca vesicaria subsp. sativa]|uniref:HMA domain-containing protein n=1 Tax=Eruca vesicaria subsp. sativa TaxID=29727 RepID=A0ABC8KCU6_ERUVS|nr:unnamed protein product [Eruca vesicaria subsp. sativa]
MGALNFLSDYLSDRFYVSIRKLKKHKVIQQTVNIKVKIDYDGCERKIKNAVSAMKGEKSVEVNRKMNKVTVSGYMPKKVLKIVQSTRKKKPELWPYVPYTMVAYANAAGAYVKRAPPGFVRKSEQVQPQPGDTNDKLMSLFHDENPNTCTIM